LVFCDIHADGLKRTTVSIGKTEMMSEDRVRNVVFCMW
jgi:hypothetical protein